MRALITGSSGQLAKAFSTRFEAKGTDYLAPPERDLDITDAGAVDAAVRTFRPDVILNCAAFNDVDEAERRPQAALAVNRDAVRHLARAAGRHGARLVHYGTDYVFDGRTERPYTETDAPSPLNRYGQSKREGEQAALEEAGGGALVLRVSWVYGDGPRNFFRKLLDWARDRRMLRVVWDQISIPTWTEDMVTWSLAALDQGMDGLWHMTPSGYASRYETARFFFKSLGQDRIVLPVGSDAFPSPARRPFFSALSNRQLADALPIPLPSWETGVERFVDGMRRKGTLAT